jgi:hypothetical protein
MANGLTGLIPTLYAALDVVSRELVGVIPAMSMDATLQRAAVGQSVLSFVAPAVTATNITPGVTPPNDGDQTIGNIPITITKARRVPIRWNGEDTKGLNNNGPGVSAIKVAQVAQAVRTLVNEIEADCAALAATFSRASGTVSTDPFATNLGDPAQIRKILSDNGAPLGDLHGIINTSAGAAMRTLTQLTKANEAGETSLLRQGVLLNIHDISFRESAKIIRPVSGTASGATTDATGYAVGATTIVCSAAGTGTIVAGDFIKFAGDPNYYGVTTGMASAAAGGTIVIAAPGLLVAMSAAAKAITVAAISSRNMFFARTALYLAHRLPALPEEGDLAVDRTTVTDERSGLSFEIAQYAQYRQMQYEISCVWGVANVKPEHTAVLFGA